MTLLPLCLYCDSLYSMDEQTVNNGSIVGNDSNIVYEVSYILLPTIGEDGLTKRVGDIKSKATSLGANLVSGEDGVMIDLAYPMTKVSPSTRVKVKEGYFGWLKFELNSDLISEFKKYLDNQDDVVRYLIIKTVKENTLLNGKMKLKTEDKSKKVSDGLVEEDEVVSDDSPIEEDLGIDEGEVIEEKEEVLV